MSCPILRSNPEPGLAIRAWAHGALLRILAGAVLALASGCHSYPAQAPAVAEVDIEASGSAIDRDELLERLATASSPRFLGMFQGVVYEYEIFDEALLERDLERIERFYRARGYYEAKVTAARVVRLDAHRVRVEFRTYEGPPVLTGEVKRPGLSELPIRIAAQAIAEIRLERGEPFDEDVYEETKRRMLRVLTDGGYAFAKVSGKADVDIAAHVANVEFDVKPGPPTTYGPITVDGLQGIPEDKVRNNLLIEEGDPYSHSDLEDARRALVSLGVFSTVRVTADLSQPQTKQAPIRVEVQESAPRTLRLGGGVRLDTLQLSSHLTAGWEHRNFLGGMRRFTIEGRPGLVFFPSNVNTFDAPDRVLFQSLARVSLRQPSLFEGRTTGVLSNTFNVFPLLYPSSTASDPIVGFTELKASAGLERAFFNHHLRAHFSLNWQADFPIDYRGLTLGARGENARDDLLTGVIVTYPELATYVDLRDDPLAPHAGAFFGNTVQTAVPLLGGDVMDIRVEPEARFYVPLSRHVTLATRFATGFLFPFNYADTLTQDTSAADEAAVVRDQQKLIFRAFYSGGPNSNRGYPFRGVGPQGPLGFLSRSSIDCLAPENENDDRCQRPLGGLTLWESSLEVRFPLKGPVGAVTFLDASDVTRNVVQFRSNAPHLSAGIGFRYSTPVGPLRLDAGYRIPGMQSPDPEEDPGGIPVAVYFGLGEAF